MDAHTDAALLEQAAQREAEAQHILATLDLVRRWSRYGRPVLVGAVAYGLVVAPDIDVEIYCPRPAVADGFAVVAELAAAPGVWKVRYANELDGPDQGLYWQLRYRNPRSPTHEVWKIDMWMLPDDHPGPCAADLVEPMRRVLTPETRAAILRLKAATAGRTDVHGIDIYRAVLDGAVRTPADFDAWSATHGDSGLTNWRPRE